MAPVRIRMRAELVSERARRLPRGLVWGSVLVAVATGIVLATQREHGRTILHDLGTVSMSALTAAFLCIVGQWSCQILRLWALVPSSIPLTLGRTAYAYAVGSWFNILVPARAGDAVKVVLMNRVGDARPATVPQATGVMLADKVIDVASFVLLCAAAGLLDLLRVATHKRPPAWVWIALALLGLLTVVAVRALPRRTFTKLVRLQREFVAGLAALADPFKVSVSTAFSMGVWFTEILAMRVLCAALGYNLSIPQFVIALAALNVGTAVPISVASVGVYEASLAVGLHASGVPMAAALVVATLHHALELLVTSIGALAAHVAAGRETARGRS
jgi:uncharacterized membrane protein YbhN (UPF0104 family)